MWIAGRTYRTHSCALFQGKDIGKTSQGRCTAGPEVLVQRLHCPLPSVPWHESVTAWQNITSGRLGLCVHSFILCTPDWLVSRSVIWLVDWLVHWLPMQLTSIFRTIDMMSQSPTLNFTWFVFLVFYFILDLLASLRLPGKYRPHSIPKPRGGQSFSSGKATSWFHTLFRTSVFKCTLFWKH